MGITNLKELNMFLESEWKITDSGDINDIISDLSLLDKNEILKEYVHLIGRKIRGLQVQDVFFVDSWEDYQGTALIGFVIENQGNWTLATLPDSEIVLSDVWYLSEERERYEYETMPFGLIECLITFTLQEVYCGKSEYHIWVDEETHSRYLETCEAIWDNKHYYSDRGNYSFFYNYELGGLVYNHFGGIHCNSEESYERIVRWVYGHSSLTEEELTSMVEQELCRLRFSGFDDEVIFPQLERQGIPSSYIRAVKRKINKDSSRRVNEIKEKAEKEELQARQRRKIRAIVIGIAAAVVGGIVMLTDSFIPLGLLSLVVMLILILKGK